MEGVRKGRESRGRGRSPWRMNFFWDHGVSETHRVGHTRLHDHSHGRKNAFGDGFGSDGGGSPKPRLRHLHHHRHRGRSLWRTNFFGDRGVSEARRVGHSRLHDHSQGRQNAFGHGFGCEGRGSPKPRLRHHHHHRHRTLRGAMEDDPPRTLNGHHELNHRYI